MYPCRMHPDLCVAVDTVPHHSAHLYPPDVESFEINHSYYVQPENSPVSFVHNYLLYFYHLKYYFTAFWNSLMVQLVSRLPKQQISDTDMRSVVVSE